MTDTEADELAKRIINAFRGGPPLAEWRDALSPLDAGRAGTAFVRLRGQLDNAPSIARFMAEYRSLDTHDASTRQHCPICDGSGWQPAPDRQDGTVTRTVECDQCTPTDTAPCRACGGRRKVDRQFPHLVSQVKPCTCDEGRRRAESTAWRDRRAS